MLPVLSIFRLAGFMAALLQVFGSSILTCMALVFLESLCLEFEASHIYIG